MASSAVLRGVERPDAWAILPLVWLWGLAATSAARSGPAPAWAAVLAGALVRLPLVGTPPWLSDDGYRYLWEGLAANQGINPFLVPPSAVRGLDDALAARVNHGDLTSIYPPLALAWFRANAIFFRDLWGLQLTTAAVDLVTVGVLARVAPRGYGWVYALHPLAALEAASGAHLEPVAIAATVGVLTSARGAPWLAALGVWTKLFPVAFWPSLFPGRPWRAALALLATAIGGVILAAPYLAAGAGLVRSGEVYARTWEFNGLVWPWLALALGPGARPLLLLGMAVVAGLAWWRALPPARAWLWVGTAFVALGPTAHPWYGLWALVPAIALGRWGWSVAGVSLLGAYGVLSGLDPATGVWVEPRWLWYVTWIPALAAVGAELGYRRREETPTAP